MQEIKLTVFERNNTKVAELISEGLILETPQDALDLLATAQYEGADHLIVYEKHFDTSFFDLKTGVAGEILQKYSNYGVKLAIIGSFEKYTNNALRDFIRECNRGRQIFFVSDSETALAKFFKPN